MTTHDQGGDKPNVKADGTPYPEETAEARCVLEPYAHVSCWHPDSDPAGTMTTRVAESWPLGLVQAFVDSLTETEGYVPGEWPEYEAVLEVLERFSDEVA